MKRKDIKEFKITDGCYGEQLSVNGIDYDDLSEEDVIEFITEMLENDLNREILIKETFMKSLHYLQYDSTFDSNGTCDQCGSDARTIRYTKDQ